MRFKLNPLNPPLHDHYTLESIISEGDHWVLVKASYTMGKDTNAQDGESPVSVVVKIMDANYADMGKSVRFPQSDSLQTLFYVWMMVFIAGCDVDTLLLYITSPGSRDNCQVKSARRTRSLARRSLGRELLLRRPLLSCVRTVRTAEFLSFQTR